MSWIEYKGATVERIIHESGPLSIWLMGEFAAFGAPVVRIDTRAAYKAHSARKNKLDRFDAEALAQTVMISFLIVFRAKRSLRPTLLPRH